MAASLRVGLIVGVAVIAAGASIAYVELRDREPARGPTAAIGPTSAGSAEPASAVETPPARETAAPPSVPAAPAPPSSAPSPPPAPPTPPAPPPEDNQVEATKFLVTARTEMTAGRYREALNLLHQAYEMAPEPSTLLDLARMQHRTGECRVARQSARRVVNDASDAALIEQAERLLEEIGRCD